MGREDMRPFYTLSNRRKTKKLSLGESKPSYGGAPSTAATSAGYSPKQACSNLARPGILSWASRKAPSSHQPSALEASQPGKLQPSGIVRWFITKWTYRLSSPSKYLERSAASGLGVRMISMSKRAPKGVYTRGCVSMVFSGSFQRQKWSRGRHVQGAIR